MMYFYIIHYLFILFTNGLAEEIDEAAIEDLIKRDISFAYPHNESTRFGIFKSEKVIWDVMEQQRLTQSVQVGQLMAAYQSCVYRAEVPYPAGKRKPFIVVEGNVRKYRRLVAIYLARIYGVLFTSIPPKCLTHLRYLFPPNTKARNAFYALALYAAAHKAKETIARGLPVIMNGYYTEQASFIITRLFPGENLPPKGAKVYEWPLDLLKPDVVVYLNYPFVPNNHLSERPELWRLTKKIRIYKNFDIEPVLVINVTRGVYDTVKQVQDEIIKAVGDKLDLNPLPREEINEDQMYQ
uniref:Fe/B12 periplasmic-binding domain-containing protein n=1 Tax=Clastoptera arizonana TaxID=38151 RepID=A0A1B6C2K5_9HEMI